MDPLQTQAGETNTDCVDDYHIIYNSLRAFLRTGTTILIVVPFVKLLEVLEHSGGMAVGLTTFFLVRRTSGMQTYQSGS